MELGLSLGNPDKPFPFFTNSSKSNHQKPPTNKGSLDFCMALGLKSSLQPPPDRSQHSDDDDEAASTDDNNNHHLQLNLLPPAPPLQISLPWSSDNGSSENGSSGNIPAARGLDVNRIPAAAEEVSSANSMGVYRNGNLLGSNNKREFEAIGNDDGGSRGSDDDENGPNGRKKLRLSKEQSAFLEESFKEHNTLNPKQKLALAKQLNLRPRQVEVWFQNRRARTKLKQTEVDCEYLKRCCETLSEENRRLHKELQELRALKTSSPFYMQPPATTLTMCPSCERVATTSSATTTPPVAKTTNRPVESAPKAVPFRLTSRPRFYPFSQSSSHANQPAAT